MTNEERIHEKVLEALRILAETLPLFSSPEIPKLTLWVNQEAPDHTHTPAYDSELKKIPTRKCFISRKVKNIQAVAK